MTCVSGRNGNVKWLVVAVVAIQCNVWRNTSQCVGIKPAIGV